MGFPGGSDYIESACNVGEFDPWLGKSPGEEHGNPPQYSCTQRVLIAKGCKYTFEVLEYD